MTDEQAPARRFSWRAPEGRLVRRGLLLAAATFVVGFLLAAGAMWIGAGGRDVVTVPNLRELSLDDAEEVVDDADLLLEVSDSLPNPRVDAGRILTQSPLPGQEAMPGITVQVIVSSGAERHPVPPVAGLVREQAEQLLRATGLQPEVEEVTDLSRAGRVLGTVPEAGTVLAVPSRIRLLVSSGPPLVGVPELVGLHEMDIYGVLDAAGLRLGELTRELRLVEPEGQVVAQQPAAGDSIPAGSSVDVFVSTQRLELLPREQFR
ncbi:MAG TPA: PASTA domain-containing protein [Longimicrobiaceae bacterium]